MDSILTRFLSVHVGGAQTGRGAVQGNVVVGRKTGVGAQRVRRQRPHQRPTAKHYAASARGRDRQTGHADARRNAFTQRYRFGVEPRYIRTNQGNPVSIYGVCACFPLHSQNTIIVRSSDKFMTDGREGLARLG